MPYAAKNASIERTGIEYVTQAEFARRLEVSRQAISDAIKRGVITTTKVKGDSRTLIEYQKQKENYQKKKRAYPAKLKPDTAGYAIGVRNVTPEDVDYVHEDFISDVEDEHGQHITIHKYNDEDFSDCWIWSNKEGGWLMNKETQLHVIDWKKADQKVRALIHNQQLQERAGELILKTDIEQALAELYMPLTTELRQIPDRFASRITAALETALEQQLDDVTKQLVRSVLISEADNIIESLRLRTKKVLQ